MGNGNLWAKGLGQFFGFMLGEKRGGNRVLRVVLSLLDPTMFSAYYVCMSRSRLVLLSSRFYFVLRFYVFVLFIV